MILQHLELLQTGAFSAEERAEMEGLFAQLSKSKVSK